MPSHFKNSARDYFFLALCASLAYLPVTTMTYALKNDILALEYPIKFFISQCLREGISPLWFNTWALGFPLESILTWSVHSPLQLFFGLLFDYSIYTLHIEFIFYICLSGWSMLYFLRKHITDSGQLSWIIACCYMLSGFNVGSSQWLLYITATAFIPLCISFLLDILKKPSFENALSFSAIFYTMLTSVYAAFNIVTAYVIILIVLLFFSKLILRKENFKKHSFYLIFSGFITLLLCTPALLSTWHLLPFIDRGSAINANIHFFNSNYLPPGGLASMFIPFSSVRSFFTNTEGTMFHNYIGLFPLVFAPLAFKIHVEKRAYIPLACLIISFVFLCISFGNITPFRQWLNVLPGFSYFRNPGLFRVFFSFFFLVFCAFATKSQTAFFKSSSYTISLLTFTALFFVLILLNISSTSTITFNNGLKAGIQSLTLGQAILISSFIQFTFLLTLLIAKKLKRFKYIGILFGLELILNTLICTPYFTVSSYSVHQVNNILKIKHGFPVQNDSIHMPVVLFKDKSANFYHPNVFQKKVAGKEAYWGPLVLRHFTSADSTENSIYKNPLLYIDNTGVEQWARIDIQKPNFVSAHINTKQSVVVHFLQNYYPGWEAKLDNKPLSITIGKKGGMDVNVSTRGQLKFIYNKPFLWYLILLINIMVVTIFLYGLLLRLRIIFSFPLKQCL